MYRLVTPIYWNEAVGEKLSITIIAIKPDDILKYSHTLFSRYLKEQIKQLKEEKNMAVSALTRYKVSQIKKEKTKKNWSRL